MSFPAAGVGSHVVVGSATVANIDMWTVTPKGQSKDTTPFQASGSWQVNTPTIKEWDAKWDGRLDPGDTNGQLVILQNVNSTYTIKMYWTGTAIALGGQFKSSANDVVLATYNWQGTGPLTLTNV
jgi:hypothetical protein